VLSGMRLSEVACLRWSSVDLANRVITLTRTKSNRVRRIPIHDAFAALLGPAADADPATWVFRLPTLPTGAKQRLRAEDVRRKHYVTKAFARAVTEAGIVDLHFHDLRHDFATRLRRSGAGIDAIAKLLGHSTLTMATRYAHLDDPTLRQAVRELVPPSTQSSVKVVDLSARRRRRGD
jgi:integrase/recombinase XerD